MNTKSTQGNSAQNSTASEKTVNFGYPCAAHALEAFWDKFADNLTPDELRWFSDLTEAARQKSDNLHELLMTLGVLMGSADNSAQPCEGILADILFDVADQVKTMSAIIGIADRARSRLRHPELYDSSPETKNPD